MPWKCLVITLFGRLNCNYVCTLLLWGLLLVSTSRYSVKVHRMSNLSALTCKSASWSCLRIHLDCPTAVKSNLFGPQDCLKRSEEAVKVSSYIIWDSISSDKWLSGESAVSIVSSCGSILAPRKDDGTDFGCAWIQSNGLIALEIKCYLRRHVNSCSTSELMQYHV